MQYLLSRLCGRRSTLGTAGAHAKALQLLILIFPAIALAQGLPPAPVPAIEPAPFDPARVSAALAAVTHVVSNSSQLFAALQEAPQRDLGIVFQGNYGLLNTYTAH